MEGIIDMGIFNPNNLEENTYALGIADFPEDQTIPIIKIIRNNTNPQWSLKDAHEYVLNKKSWGIEYWSYTEAKRIYNEFINVGAKVLIYDDDGEQITLNSMVKYTI
jgi:ribosomal protein L7/L12